MENWRIIKLLVRALHATVIVLGLLRLYSSVCNPPEPIITGEKQTKKSDYIPICQGTRLGKRNLILYG